MKVIAAIQGTLEVEALGERGLTALVPAQQGEWVRLDFERR